MRPSLDIRLLVLDIDGTLVDESNRVRERVVHALRSVQSRGVAVALATGRLFRTALPIYRSLELTLPLICCEGALIRHPDTDVVLGHWPLDRGVAARWLDQTEQLRLDGRLSVHFHIQDDIYSSNPSEASAKYFAGSNAEPIVVPDLRRFLDQAPTKVMVVSEDAEVIARLGRDLTDWPCRFQFAVHNSVTVLEAFHPDVNKEIAVRYLAEEILSLRPENVMAIGDEVSDIEMLQYAGLGVAMGNAPATVQAVADWLTTSNAEDGVARAVEKWILVSSD
jgi:Cof subfamily protein (haloacid dehalogenase superfamily)